MRRRCTPLPIGSLSLRNGVQGLPSQREPKLIRNTIIFPASLDPDAVKIVRRLKRFGFEAYFVGGCVRDLLLGAIPKDYDVATSARPRQIRKLFRNSKIIGRRFKLVHVIFRDKIIEVSTFRQSPQKETASPEPAEPEAGKPPQADSEQFKRRGLLVLRDNIYGEARDDALRRDFTINSLFYDVGEEAVVDYTGGYDDLQNRVIRSIGPPSLRFCEDPVRILRAIRFHCRLDLRLDDDLLQALKENASEISKCAPPRVMEEITRILSCGASSHAVRMMFKHGLIRVLFPELDEIAEREAAYFGTDLSGRTFLERLTAEVDRHDRGRRKYPDSLFLAVLFSPVAGVAMEEALALERPPPDLGSVISDTLRPIGIRMSIPRRHSYRARQILFAFRRFGRKRGGRLSARKFILKNYFADALEFYRLVTEALDVDRARYGYWFERWTDIRQGRTGPDPSRQGKPPDGGKRRRRPRGRRKKRT